MPSCFAGLVIVGRIIIKSRKNMKRVVLFCIIICLVAPIEMVAKKKSFGNGLYWELSDNGNLVISGKGDMPNYTNKKKAPWSKEQYNRVIIDDGITSIGDLAFFHSNLSSIKIAHSVTHIGKYSFANCKYLTSVEIPPSVASIDNAAFINCEMISSIVLPNSVVSIGEWLFAHCEKLQSVTLSQSISSINNNMFRGCQCLKEVIMPSNIKTIGDNSFLACRNLDQLEIPSSVTTIGEAAFFNCSNLKSILIPNSVISIGKDAFICYSNGNPLLYNNQIISLPNWLIAKGKSSWRDYGLSEEAVNKYVNGIHDKNGRLLLPAQNGRTIKKMSAEFTSYDYYIIEEGYSKGIIKDNGSWIVPLTTKLGDYSDINLAGDNYIRIKNNGYYGIITFDCQIIIPTSRCYTSIGNYNSSKGTFAFTKKGVSGVCDMQGREISTTKLAPTANDIKADGGYASAVEMKNGSTKYYKVSKGGRYGLTDSDGKEIIPCEMEALESAGSGYLKYKLNGFWGVMNYAGKIIIDTDRGYTSIGDFKTFNKRFAYTMTGYKGECDATGRQISKMKVETPKQNTSVVSSSSSSSSSSSDSKNNNSGNKTTTVVVEHHRDPVPVQDWVPCSVCGHNPGVCQTCVGNKTNYRGDPCISCRGTGKCHFCNGQGGRYQIVYR